MRIDPAVMHETLSWTLLSLDGSDWGIADLMARELDPRFEGAVDLIASGAADLETLTRAKLLFKTLRLEGETESDRALGAHLYASSIAAALVRFGERISRQRDESLRHAFQRMAGDPHLPPPLQEIASKAAAKLRPQT